MALYNQRDAGRVFDAGIKAYQDAPAKSGHELDLQLLIVNKMWAPLVDCDLMPNCKPWSIRPAGEEEYVSSYVDPVTKQKHHLRMRDRVMI